MRTRQALKNTIASLLLQVVLALSGIIVPRFFTELYGSSINGLVSSISQFIMYMSLVEAGIGAAGTVALYRPIAAKDNRDISRVVSAARIFYLHSGMIFAGLLSLLLFVYPAIVRDELQNASFVRMMIFVLSVNGLVDYFFLGKYRMLLQADQKGYVISFIQILGTVVMTIISIWLIQLKASALLVKGTAAAIYLLRSLAVSFYVRRNYPHISFHARPDMAAFSQRWAALLHQIVGMVVCNTDIVLLTLLLPANALREVSIYSVYNLVSYSLSNLMNSISNALGSGFGQVISQDEKDVLNKSYSSYEFLFFILIFIAYVCMGILLHGFIVVYSASFQDGSLYARWSLVVLFTLAGLLQSLRLPGLTVLCAAGHYRQTQVRAVIEAVINLGVSIALIGPLGIEGVLIGTCLSYLYRTVDIILYSAGRFTEGSLKLTLRRLIRNVFTGVLLLAVGICLIPQKITGWFSWFTCAIISGCVVSPVFLTVNLLAEPEQRQALRQRMGNILAK